MIPFEQLISTQDGKEWLKAEYTRVFNRPPVGDCNNCLRDMYFFLINVKNKIDMAKFTFKLKHDYKIVQIAGSVEDLSTFSQKDIQDFLATYPDAVSFFDKQEIEQKTK